MITEAKTVANIPHNMIMENRKKLMLTGIREVDSFDEQTVSLVLENADLAIRGKNLTISRLNVETGEVSVTGDIYAIIYSDNNAKQSGLFGRLFK